MDKCPNCGCPTGCHAVGVAALWQPEIDGTHFDCMTIAWEDGQVDVGMDCLRRQLAAANERAGRLEAQMVELREAWADYAPDALDGRLISLHGVTAHRSWPKLTRILGGA